MLYTVCVQCEACGVQCEVGSVKCTVCTVQPAVYNMQCEVCSFKCALKCAVLSEERAILPADTPPLLCLT